jgi:hypothetical protein
LMGAFIPTARHASRPRKKSVAATDSADSRGHSEVNMNCIFVECK